MTSNSELEVVVRSMSAPEARQRVEAWSWKVEAAAVARLDALARIRMWSTVLIAAGCVSCGANLGLFIRLLALHGRGPLWPNVLMAAVQITLLRLSMWNDRRLQRLIRTPWMTPWE